MQLIDTRSGYHLWSGKFDRAIADLFIVEDEISRTIADTLQGLPRPCRAPRQWHRRRQGARPLLSRPLPSGPAGRLTSAEHRALRERPGERLHLRAGVGGARRSLRAAPGLLSQLLCGGAAEGGACRAAGAGARQQAGSRLHRPRQHPPGPAGVGQRRARVSPGAKPGPERPGDRSTVRAVPLLDRSA